MPAPSKPINYPKAFGLAGLVLGEIYMLFVMLAPNTAGIPVVSALSIVSPAAFATLGPQLADFSSHFGAKLGRVAFWSIFFGPFGALVGTGVGIIAAAFAGSYRRR